MARFLLASLLVLSACGTAPPSVATLAAGNASRDRVVTIPVTNADGSTTPIQTRLCRPAAEGSSAGARAGLVVINHGSPPSSAARPRMQLRRCDEEATRWFLARGYVVALPLRRGYGANGGIAPEASPSCRESDFVHAGLESARDIEAVIDHLTAVPFIRPDRVVVVGQSAGGWGVDALNSVPHPKVAALISMAGGRGGHYEMQPGRNCHPERLVDAAGRFGATSTTPMLWIYTANDSYFAPPLAQAMHEAFTQAGGRAAFHQLPAYGQDGHNLFFGSGGSALWGPLVDAYLAAQGVHA